eukprot:1197925-Pleurochrysis_carterae.AAC.1
MNPMLRRPSRKCLLRRAALRRALDAIMARLQEAIGADVLLLRGGGRSRSDCITLTGDQARFMRWPSMKGRSNTKSTTASLRCSSALLIAPAVVASSAGVDVKHDFDVSTVKRNAGSKSTREM